MTSENLKPPLESSRTVLLVRYGKGAPRLVSWLVFWSVCTAGRTLGQGHEKHFQGSDCKLAPGRTWKHQKHGSDEHLKQQTGKRSVAGDRILHQDLGSIET